MKPLVSILIPAFNAQQWIAETLNSALAQTWGRKEIIVVDDGSTDDTLAIARRFASHELRVVTQENQGAAAARNNALSLSQGDYVQWLDADDLLAPDKIARQILALQHCPSDRTLLSSAWARFMYRPHRAVFVPSSLWCDLTPAEWLCRSMAENVYMPPATWLVSRSLSEAAGPWDTTLTLDDDGEYFSRVIIQSDSIRFVRDARSYYRFSGSQSLSYVGQSDKKLNSQFRSIQLHIKYLRSLEDSERARAACLDYLQTWRVFFYPEKPHIFSELERLARELGGELAIPHLPSKYSWICPLFGWRLAKQAQLLLPRIRWSISRKIDQFLFFAERDRARIPRAGVADHAN